VFPATDGLHAHGAASAGSERSHHEYVFFLKFLLKFSSRLHGTISLLVNGIGVSKSGSSPARFVSGERSWRGRAFCFAIGINFLLTSRSRFRLLGLAGRRVQNGGRHREPRIGTSAPAPELNPRSVRAAVRSERHRWLNGGPLLREWPQGGNDEARPRSKYDRVTIGWFAVSSQFWKRAIETRKALEAPGPPRSRPTRKRSI
jgi:hypothetical protein